MADQDPALYTLRYNQVSQAIEGQGGTPAWNALTISNQDTSAGITQLTGDVTAGPGAGSVAASIASATVTGKLLTGYSSGAGTVSATDTILQAVNKLNGNDALRLLLTGGSIVPSADSTTVFNVKKANGTTPVFAVDTTNAIVNVGLASTFGDLTVEKATGFQESVTIRARNLTSGGNAVVQVSNDLNNTCLMEIFGSTFGSPVNGVSVIDSSNSHLMFASRGASQGIDFSFGGIGGANIKATMGSDGTLSLASGALLNVGDPTAAAPSLVLDSAGDIQIFEQSNPFSGSYIDLDAEAAHPHLFIRDHADGNLPVHSAILQANSTAQGFLPPRMTTTQKDAISSPAEGLIVYDLSLQKLCVYTGAAWETITSA